MSPLSIFILECMVLIAAPTLVWRYLGLRRIAPLTVVQIAVDLALGPAILGRAAPDVQHFIFPAANIDKLSGVATFAVVVFAFLSGMHLDEKMARGVRPSTWGIAVSSFLVPLILGVGFGHWLAIGAPHLVGPNAGPWEFSYGFGICIAVTALPVLASLLKEMGIVESDLGQQALRYAAINDAGLWASVSVLVAVVAGSHASHPWHLVWMPIYLLLILFPIPRLIRWLAERHAGRQDEDTNDDILLVVACAVAFCSSFVSEYSGIGYLLGAFLGGAAMPVTVRARLIRRLDWTTTFILMPFFFMTTGLRTQADITSESLIGIVVATTAVASADKIAGVAVPSMLSGEPWRRSLALGALLQSKGLMEVLVITVLADAGIVSSQIFSVLILVAVICTTAAMPLTILMIGGARTREATIGYRSTRKNVDTTGLEQAIR